MKQWADITDQLPAQDRQVGRVEVLGRVIAVCRVDGRWHAFADSCPHAAMPLVDGDLRGRVLVCPFHGYAYDVTNGRCVGSPDDPPLRLFEIRRNGDRVELGVECDGDD